MRRHFNAFFTRSSPSPIVFQSIEHSLQTDRRPVVQQVQANAENQRKDAVDDRRRLVARLRTSVADQPNDESGYERQQEPNPDAAEPYTRSR